MKKKKLKSKLSLKRSKVSNLDQSQIVGGATVNCATAGCGWTGVNSLCNWCTGNQTFDCNVTEDCPDTNDSFCKCL